MSRRRYLSTAVSLDKRVNRLAEESDFAALLYTWMIPHAADDATLPADPEELMFQVVPGRRSKSVQDIIGALTTMAALGLIEWDPSRGLLRFPVETFYRHQTYIKGDRRAGAEQREQAQDADDSANQRKSAQNAASFKSSFSSSVKSSSPVSNQESTQNPTPVDDAEIPRVAASNGRVQHDAMETTKAPKAPKALEPRVLGDVARTILDGLNLPRAPAADRLAERIAARYPAVDHAMASACCADWWRRNKKKAASLSAYQNWCVKEEAPRGGMGNGTAEGYGRGLREPGGPAQSGQDRPDGEKARGESWQSRATKENAARVKREYGGSDLSPVSLSNPPG